LSQRKTTVPILDKFLEVCIDGSVKLYGANGNMGPVWGGVEGDKLTVTRPRFFNKSTKANLILIGLRSDCAQNPWPELTREDFERNEARLNMTP